MRARRSSRLPLRCLLTALLLVAAGGGRAERATAADPVVRVLLVESSEPVGIRSPIAHHRIELAREGGRLVVDRQPVGSTWAAPGEGPWTVADHRYRGRLLVHATSTTIQVVDHVALEDYVAATVGGELPASWPDQALRAQAVATRTYALHRRERRGGERSDLRATEQS